MSVHPRREREIEARQWIVMDDVFGDRAEYPEYDDAHSEAQRQVDHQIFCASEFSGDKSPQPLVVRAELR